MDFEMVALAVLSAVCCVVGLFVAKFFEWRQDVLYGSYVERGTRRKD